MDNQVNNYLSQIAQQIIQKYPYKLKIITNQTTIKVKASTHTYTIATTNPPTINNQIIDLSDHEQIVKQIQNKIDEIINHLDRRKRHL